MLTATTAYKCMDCDVINATAEKRHIGRAVKGQKRSFVYLCVSCLEVAEYDDSLGYARQIQAAYCQECAKWFRSNVYTGWPDDDEDSINWHNIKWPNGHEAGQPTKE